MWDDYDDVKIAVSLIRVIIIFYVGSVFNLEPLECYC